MALMVKGYTSLISLGILLVAILISLTTISLKPKTTIFTCTTFFDFKKQDKWAAFCKAIDSILQQHDEKTLTTIQKWLIVNEYSESPRRNWVQEVAKKYPFIEVIQKSKEEKGQATSMNLILQQIKGHTYWIHWEETWYCRRPCLDRMLDVIQNSTVTQLQVTQHKEKPNWLDSDAHPRSLQKTPSGTEYYTIQPSQNTGKTILKSIRDYRSEEMVPNWPLYSLLPSINRAKHYTVGDFSTDPQHWPFKFEWDYGRRWLLAGGTKAVLPDGPVIRDNQAHKSTYS